MREAVSGGQPSATSALLLAEDVTTTAPLRPVLEDLGHPLERKQRASMPDMAGLCTLLLPRPARPAALP
jgi:hypothetical protein